MIFMKYLYPFIVLSQDVYPVFIDPEISTHADRAQSSRVLVPLQEDPYEAIKQAYLVGTDTESEPFNELVKTETPESPHTVASHTCHVKESDDSDMSGARSTSLDSTTPLSTDHPLTHITPVLVPSLCRIARMAVRVLPMMSPGHSASIAEVATMPDLEFRKRFRSSYDSLPSPTLLVWNWYKGTSELILDTDSEGEELEDEEVKESLDSHSESKNVEDEGPTAEDEDPTIRDEGLAAGDGGLGLRVESLGLEGGEAVPEDQQRATSVVKKAVGEPLGLGYRALRRQEIASREGQIPSVLKVGQGYGSMPEPERPEEVAALRQPTLTTWIDLEDGRTYIDVPAYSPPAPPVQTPPSPKWSYGSLPVSLAPSIVPSPISSPMLSLIVPLPVASPATSEANGFLTELGA
uniref:Uncharacterized protein n=1 Tax=Tanacetum cinerariifolium TaxID=118510 RepID=A0A699IC42_TANCI|nr:hypothetical protein [Tanacetum cinerariifolium]